MAVTFRYTSWEDGEVSEHFTDTFDRWSIHAANELSVSICGIDMKVIQKPNAITAKKIGVGAVFWEGELVLAAYLAQQPHHRYIGARCVELGAGPGVLGIMLAKLGAQAVITDKAVVVPLMNENIKANGLSGRPTSTCSGSCRAEELEWGAEGYQQIVASLASTPLDLVLAADCCYVDQDGESPSTKHFVQALYGLCGPSTKCYVSSEHRSSEVRSDFVELAKMMFSKVTKVPVHNLPKGCQADHIEIYELIK